MPQGRRPNVDRYPAWYSVPKGSALEREYISTFLNAVTPQDFKEMIGRVVEIAKHSTHERNALLAFKILLDHILPEGWQEKIEQKDIDSLRTIDQIDEGLMRKLQAGMDAFRDAEKQENGSLLPLKRPD